MAKTKSVTGSHGCFAYYDLETVRLLPSPQLYAVYLMLCRWCQPLFSIQSLVQHLPRLHQNFKIKLILQPSALLIPFSCSLSSLLELESFLSPIQHYYGSRRTWKGAQFTAGQGLRLNLLRCRATDSFATRGQRACSYYSGHFIQTTKAPSTRFFVQASAALFSIQLAACPVFSSDP